MTTGEYILALLAIVSGLAITHLIGAASALIEHRQQVKWDWLAVTAGFYLAYIVIYGWWFSFAAFHGEVAELPFYRFLLPTVNVVFLALAARAVLPESVPDDGIDLVGHYARRCRFIFLCLLACQLIAAIGIVIRLRDGHDVRTVVPGGLAPNLIAMALIVTLAVTARRTVHAIIVPLLFLAVVAASIVKAV